MEHALAGETGHNGWHGAGLISTEPEKGKILELHSERTSYLYGVDEFKEKWPGMWEDAFKVMLVRNPYDRFISAWKFFSDVGGKSVDRVLKEKQKPAIHWHLKRPQTEGLIVNGKLDIDYLIRFENFQEEFNSFCDLIEISRRKLPHLRKSNHEDYWTYYSEDNIKPIREMFADDFKYLNYSTKI